MSNFLLCHKNRIDSATLAPAANFDGSFPLDNLKIANIHKYARTLNASRAATRFRGNLGANYVLRAFGIRNHNLSVNALWCVRISQAPLDLRFDGLCAMDERITSSGGASATYISEAGLLTPVTSPRLDHDPQRYWQGFYSSEDLTLAYWSYANAHPESANSVYLGATTGFVGQGNMLVLAGESYTISGEVLLISGGGQFRALINDGADQLSSTFTATATWQPFALTVTAATTTHAALAGLLHGSSAGELSFRELQFQSGSSALAYRKTTTTKLHLRRGLLPEPQRTNLFLRSREMDNAAWTKGGHASVTADATTGPDGTASADLFTESAAAATIRSLSQSLTITAGDTCTISCYVKQAPGAARHLRLQVSSNAGANGFRGYFNLTTGTVAVAATAFGTGTAVTGSARIAGPDANGFYRVSVSGQVDAAATSVSAGLFIQDTDSGSAIYNGDGASGLYFGPAQYEVGGTPSSQVNTTTASVTRTADDLTVTGSNFSGVYAATGGTLYVEFSTSYDQATASNTNIGVQIDDNTTNNFIQINTRTNDDASVGSVRVGGVNQASLSPGTTTYGTSQKMAMRFLANDFIVCRNGSLSSADTAGTIPTVDRLRIGSSVGTSHLNGHIKRIVYWPFGLTNAQLQAITASGPDIASVGGYDSGWISALQVSLNDTAPSNWGSQYDAMVAFDAISARYLTVDVDDTANAAGYVQMGRPMIAGGFQPTRNVSFGSIGDQVEDLSTINMAPAGKDYVYERAKQRIKRFAFNWLTVAEGDRVHEIMAEVGRTQEVFLVRDPADMAASQRYGGLGTLRQLNAVEYPFTTTRAIGFEWKHKR